MNIVERRRPQDGQIERRRSTAATLDVRVSTTPTVFGEKCVLRILDKTRALFDARASSAWPPRRYARYDDLIRSPYGMVICAGPTGLGQDHDALRDARRDQQRRDQRHDDRGPGRVRLPDDQPDPDQRAGRASRSPAGCGRSCARTPTRSSSARSATSRPRASRSRPRSPVTSSCRRCTRPTRRRALHRFMDMGIEPFLIASSLLGVVGQRLVRRICAHCMEPYTPTRRGARVLRASAAAPRQGRVRRTARAATSAARPATTTASASTRCCAVTDEMKELIVADAPHAELRDAGHRAGHAHAARPGHPSRRPRTRPPSPRCSAPCTCSRAAEEIRTMPTYRYVAVGPDGTKVKDQLDGAERGRAAQRAADAATSR